MQTNVVRSPGYSRGEITQAATNKILAALPSEERERLRAFLTPMPLRFKQLLHKQGEPITHVYFPTGGALSVIKNLSEGQVAEIATIGNEGVSGAQVFFGETENVGDTIVQVTGGDAYVIPVDAFQGEMQRRGALYNLVIRYTTALTNQIMHTSVCNSLHAVEQRACRWLLMTHDRVGRKEFQLTHEFLAAMLGVRRPTVTLVAASLQRNGLVAYRRGYISILDRPGLEATSCECYHAVQASFQRLLPELHVARG